MSIQVHNTKRCPECDTLGIIENIQTKNSIGDKKKRTRSRVYECPDCETEWKYYV
jgi:uncharacterized protein with PIN domain